MDHLCNHCPSHGRRSRCIHFHVEVMEPEDFRIYYLATLIQKTWKGWKTRRKYLHMKFSQRIIAVNFRIWKIRRYLLWLSRHLPCESPLCSEWPSAPRSLYQANHHLKKLHHKWRCHKYRLKFDQTARNRMREKVTASLLFRGRKDSYPRTVPHPFCGDYVRLRSNTKWKKIATESGDQYLVFADIINKINRSSGECVQKLLVISTAAMMVLDQRTLQMKYRIPVHDIFRISLSPFTDDIVVIHVQTSETQTKRNGAFVLESGHVIEIVTKLFLVIQNATSKSPEVQIVPKFYANFGREMVTVLFRCSTPSFTNIDPSKIRITASNPSGENPCSSSCLYPSSSYSTGPHSGGGHRGPHYTNTTSHGPIDGGGASSGSSSTVKINRKSKMLEVTL